jgi:phosphoribosylformimino-5-aminoimidazole carboxamide ribonucleotide (ProFAR) isomerase
VRAHSNNETKGVKHVETLHCLIADIPQIVLADIVQDMVEESNDIDVIGRVNTTEEILSAVKQGSVDVLVLGMKNDATPRVCVDIMNKVSNLVVVGLVDDGRKLAVYLDDVGKSEIVNIIRMFGQLNRK